MIQRPEADVAERTRRRRRDGSFLPDGPTNDSRGSWSPRRKLAFIVGSSVVLWAILIALGWLVIH